MLYTDTIYLHSDIAYYIYLKFYFYDYISLYIFAVQNYNLNIVWFYNHIINN